MGYRHPLPVIVVCLAAIAVIGAGCAGSAGSVKPSVEGQKPPAITKYQALTIRVTKADGVELQDQDLDRIAAKIVDAMKKKQPERFQSINAASTQDPSSDGQSDSGRMQVGVQLTKYDKGNAFARFMLAGLGQMHINGKVVLIDPITQAALGEYEVTKTFAWGGIYGGSTKIEDVEVGFAEGVAEALLK